MYGTAVMPNIPKALEEAAQQICPNVDVRILDGHNIKLGELARAASDIALSLVDCLQETLVVIADCVHGILCSHRLLYSHGCTCSRRFFFVRHGFTCSRGLLRSRSHHEFFYSHRFFIRNGFVC